MTARRAPDPRPAGLLDRTADLVAPRLSSLGEEGTLVAPLILVLAVSLATAGATRMWAWDLAFEESTSASMSTVLWVVAALSPVVALVKGGLLALAAWSVLILLGAPGRMRAILSAVLYGEAILALQGPVLLLTLLLQGGAREDGLALPTGLDVLVQPGHPVLLAFAHGVTPVHLAWVAFLATALATGARCTWLRGFVAAAFLWVLTTGLGVLQALAGGGMA